MMMIVMTVMELMTLMSLYYYLNRLIGIINNNGLLSLCLYTQNHKKLVTIVINDTTWLLYTTDDINCCH